MPSISIIIITYNRPEDTLALLENLKKQNHLQEHVGEILLLNNASTLPYSAVEQFLNEHTGLPVQYFNHDKNLGVAGGRNFLISKAKYPYLLVLDDDIIFPGYDAIEKLVKLPEQPCYQHPETAVITLNIFYFDSGKRQESALPHKKYRTYKDKDWFYTYYFTGAAHLMKRELFEKTGYYPEDFFYGMEEYDLSYRIIEAGYALAYDDSVKVLHKESSAGRLPPKEKLAMMWYNKCKVAWRYLPTKYYYSTALMWGLQFLRKTGFALPLFFKTLSRIQKIPGQTPTQKIGKKAMDYLRKVEARLWY